MKIFAYIGSCIGIIGFVWMLFERTDKIVTINRKKEISIWLCNLKLQGNSNLWPVFFIETFDSLFGKCHFSFHCFKRSIQASMLSVLVLSPYAIYISYENTIAVRGENPIFIILIVLVLLPVLSLVFNALPDYISILQTRFILSYMASLKSHKSILALVLLDIIITSILIVLYMLLVLGVILSAADNNANVSFLYKGFQGLLSLIQFNAPNGTSPEVGLYGTFIYSSFFMSIWSWLYAASVLLVGVLKQMDTSWSWLKGSFLDIENNPIVTLGWLSSMLLTIIFVMSAPIII